jgi:RNA polymerase sigma factor (sigma-70 family)
MQTDQEQPVELAKHVVAETLCQRGWQLVADPDGFASRVLTAVLDRVGAEQDPAGLEKGLARETVRQYAILLHDVSRLDGTPVQRRAFEELWCYLFPFALYKVRDEGQAQECTQRALVKVWEKGHQCEDPSGFLGWAKMILVNEVRMSFRKKQPLTWTDLDDEEANGEIEERIVQNPPKAGGALRPVENELAAVELTARLQEELRRALRSSAQRAVIEGVYIEGLGYKAIAERLGTTPSNIYTLKSRALDRLRRDRQFRHSLRELLE